MHDQSSPLPADPDSVEQAILSSLVDCDGPGLWSVEEVAREIDDPASAPDALAALYRAGLVHRVGDFVFATRPAVRAAQLA